MCRHPAEEVFYTVWSAPQRHALKDGEMMSLAKKLVDLRKARNLTQKELAKSIGVHFSHMSRYERGISLPSIDVVKKIAQVFNVSTDYLLLDEAQAVAEAKIPDVELLQLFQAISHMSEQERAAIKIVLEGLLVKHQIEQLLKEQTALSHTSALLPPHAQVLPWHSVNLSERLRQHLDGPLDNAKRETYPA
jgi:transcriptional regulator with XRE-family HTH domain